MTPVILRNFSENCFSLYQSLCLYSQEVRQYINTHMQHTHGPHTYIHIHTLYAYLIHIHTHTHTCIHTHVCMHAVCTLTQSCSKIMRTRLSSMHIILTHIHAHVCAHTYIHTFDTYGHMQVHTRVTIMLMS